MACENCEKCGFSPKSHRQFSNRKKFKEICKIQEKKKGKWQGQRKLTRRKTKVKEIYRKIIKMSIAFRVGKTFV